MRVRVHGSLLVGGLVVGSWFQGCASGPPVVKSAPANPAQETSVVTVPTAVEKLLPVTDESLSTAPLGESVTSSSSSTPAQSRPESKPPVTPRAEVASPVVVVKPNVKPVTKIASKPTAKVDPHSPAKPQPKQTLRATPTSKATPAFTPTPQQPQSAPAEVAPESTAEPELPPLTVVEEDVAVTLESLPMTIRGEWVLSAVGDTCSLGTLPIRFDDGQGMSKLQLVLTPQHWLIKTQSDIDLSYRGTGLTVDEGRHFPLGQLVRQSDLMFVNEREVMAQAFISGKSLHITMGFWPTWPVTETKTITISLQHFASAHRAWKQCLSLINGR